MKTLLSAATILLTILSLAVPSFCQAPWLSATQNFIENVDRKTCAKRAAEAFAKNNLAITTQEGEELCFGGNQEYTVAVFCDWCGSVVNVNISVSTNKTLEGATQLRERILEYIATGSNAGGASTGESKLWLDKNSFAPGEAITVHFTAPGTFAANAWVGMLPANIEHGSEANNDGYDMAYQYLNKRTSGTLTFTAPNQAGSYDFRMNDTDDNGKEVASVVFSVGTAAGSGGEASLKLDKTVFAPGESITVHFTASANYAANAWVGILPANIEHGSEAKNDGYDLTYQYLNKRTTGTLTYTAPNQKGSYDFRMNDTDDNGKEVAYVVFRVE
ncbi:MAG: hypothetical protein HY842_04510 [Bacteroidetes bacterium]|nr:hypothetical protein [Bacteroidota bacterium]